MTLAAGDIRLHHEAAVLFSVRFMFRGWKSNKCSWRGMLEQCQFLLLCMMGKYFIGFDKCAARCTQDNLRQLISGEKETISHCPFVPWCWCWMQMGPLTPWRVSRIRAHHSLRRLNVSGSEIELLNTWVGTYGRSHSWVSADMQLNGKKSSEWFVSHHTNTAASVYLVICSIQRYQRRINGECE